VVILSTWDHECSQFESHQICAPLNKIFECSHFGNVTFWQQKILCILLTKETLHHPRGSNPQLLCYKALCDTTLPLLCCSVENKWRNFVIYRGDWLSIKFGENDSFRKLFLFFENTFQYLGGISQDISGSHFDSRRSLSSANRRQIVGDLPGRFFLSALLSLVISMTGRSERSARALRDGADVVREAIGN
jgi:hypothetical protein